MHKQTSANVGSGAASGSSYIHNSVIVLTNRNIEQFRRIRFTGHVDPLTMDHADRNKLTHNAMNQTRQTTDPVVDAPAEKRRFVFTLRSILVITAVMAVSAMAAGHLFRVVQGSPEDVGPFALVAAIAPLGLMIVTNWLFRLFGKL